MGKKWIVYRSGGENSEVNLLMFVYAGGSPSFFAPWKKLFDTSISMCPVLYPGREIRKNEPVPTSLKEMVHEFVDESSDLFVKDFVLFGQCTGSIIAYETAKYVYEKYGRFPLAFITSSMDSPRYYDCYKALYDENGNEVSDMDMAKRMVEQGIISKDFLDDKKFLEYYMPIFKNDLKMFECTNKEEPFRLGCNIYCMSGTEDEFISNEGLHDWENYTSGSISYATTHGGHFYIADQKEFVSSEIKKYIDIERMKKTNVRQVQNIRDSGIYNQYYKRKRHLYNISGRIKNQGND